MAENRIAEMWLIKCFLVNLNLIRYSRWINFIDLFAWLAISISIRIDCMHTVISARSIFPYDRDSFLYAYIDKILYRLCTILDGWVVGWVFVCACLRIFYWFIHFPVLVCCSFAVAILLHRFPLYDLVLFEFMYVFKTSTYYCRSQIAYVNHSMWECVVSVHMFMYIFWNWKAQREARTGKKRLLGNIEREREK